MKKTTEKAKKISEIITELENWKKEVGDAEVFIANTDEACFDGIGKIFVMKISSTGENHLCIIRSDVVLKI